MKNTKFIGKTIAFIFIALCLFLILFLPRLSTPALDINETNSKVILDKKPNQDKKNDKALIKELKNALNSADQNRSKGYKTGCAPCHGIDAKGKIAPKIAGRSKEEILKAFENFKTHPNPLMSGVILNISKQDLILLADEISSFK